MIDNNIGMGPNDYGRIVEYVSAPNIVRFDPQLFKPYHVLYNRHKKKSKMLYRNIKNNDAPNLSTTKIINPHFFSMNFEPIPLWIMFGRT